MMNPRFKECRRLGLNVCGHPKAMNRAKKVVLELTRSFQIMECNYLKSKGSEHTME